MRLNEITDTHPDYWKARYIDTLNPNDPPYWKIPITKHPSTPDQETQAGIERFKKAMAIVEPHCKEIVAAYKQAGKFLYRGAKGRGKDIFVAGIRPDRTPGYLSQNLHNIEGIAVKKMGGVASRGNSIFCSNSVSTAADWGDDVFVIFPKDGWQTTYFTGLEQGEYAYDYLSAAGDHAKVKDLIEVYENIGTEFDKQQLPAYMKKISELEVLITGDSYIGISVTKFEYLLDLWLKGNPLNTRPRSLKDIKR